MPVLDPDLADTAIDDLLTGPDAHHPHRHETCYLLDNRVGGPAGPAAGASGSGQEQTCAHLNM